MSEIKSKFNSISLNYDKQRKQLIPCLEDFYNISVSMIESTTDIQNILDIGAGTGLFSSYVLKKFPKAKITLIDISEKMLEIAQQRFLNYKDFKYIAYDYTKYDFVEKYDIIISALSIHHLTNTDKEALYKKCFLLLKPNGVFINADQVIGNTPYLDSLYKKNWKTSVENSGLSSEEILSTYERNKLDKEDLLSQQLTWMKEVGFSDVDCIYKYYHFAVLYGRKIL